MGSRSPCKMVLMMEMHLTTNPRYKISLETIKPKYPIDIRETPDFSNLRHVG